MVRITPVYHSSSDDIPALREAPGILNLNAVNPPRPTPIAPKPIAMGSTIEVLSVGAKTIKKHADKTKIIETVDKKMYFIK
jgi:hypothetical protein